MKLFTFVHNLFRDAIRKYYVTSAFVFLFFISAAAASRFYFGYEQDFQTFLGFDFETNSKLMFTFLFSSISSLLIYRIDSVLGGRLGRIGILLSSLAVLLLWGFYFMSNDWWNLSTYLSDIPSRKSHYYGQWIVLAFCQFAMFFSLPFRRREGLGRHIWSVVGIISQAFILSLFLMLGLFFIAFTLNNLFELSQYQIWINEYPIILAFCFALVFPHFCLALYAREESAWNDFKAELNFISRALLYYIFMPLLIVYTVVLYFYFSKLAIGGVFPDNIMANLVVWYLFAAHIAVYFITGIHEYKNEFERWIVENSRKYLPLLVLPAVMMFASIFIRISAYGFTEMRYLLLAFGIFNTVGLTMLFFFREKAQFAIVLTAVCISTVAVFGELSMGSVTYRSQLAQLEQKLAAAGYSYGELASGELNISSLQLTADDAVSVLSSLVKVKQNMPLSQDSQFVDNLYAAVRSQAYMNAYYRDADMEDYTYIRNYYYNHVHKISDSEFIFDITLGQNADIDDLFHVVAEKDGLRIFELSDRDKKNPLYFEGFVESAAADGVTNTVYSGSFLYAGDTYNISIVLQDFAYAVDREGKLVHDDFGNTYSVIVILNRK